MIQSITQGSFAIVTGVTDLDSPRLFQARLQRQPQFGIIFNNE
jgi:hypothetical protein